MPSIQYFLPVSDVKSSIENIYVLYVRKGRRYFSMAITIKDIASITGVGISTVSRVLNNTGPVSQATRKKVLEAVSQHNYIPNSSARNLKSVQTKNIGLLVKDITNPFFNKMIRVIEREVALRGYTLLLQNIDNAWDEMDIAIRETQDKNLCGVMLMGGAFSYTEQKFRQLGIPCVLITIAAGDSVDQSLYSSVTINDEQEGYRITDYLISLGHRQIGFICYSAAEMSTPNYMRYQGYVRALEEHNIPLEPKLLAMPILESDSGYAKGFYSFKQLYSQNRNMTAVFAFADILAIGAAKAAFSLGLRIPEDISIVGFDGIEMAEFFQPSLDTLYQPANEMALSAVATLFDMMNNMPSRHIVYDGVLLKRGSSQAINFPKE